MVAEEPADRTCSRRDRGTTFIELLVSIVIVGSAGIAVLTTISSTARGAAEHRRISDAQAWLASLGDAIIDVDTYYRDCDSEPDPSVIASEYETNIIDPITSSSSLAPTTDITAVEFWNSSTGNFGSTCRYSSHGDRLQRITLQTTITGKIRTLTVDKRPAVPPTVGTLPPPAPPSGGVVVPEPNPFLP